ncbi:hypothetical protein MANI_002850 [Metarhizium anisopliae]
MPVIYLSYPEGTFSPDNLNSTADHITRDAVGLEKLPLTGDALSATMIYAREYPRAYVFHGGKPGGNRFVAVDINVLQGGYSATTKTELIKRVTDTIEKYGQLSQGGPRRVHVVIREVAEAN